MTNLSKLGSALAVSLVRLYWQRTNNQRKHFFVTGSTLVATFAPTGFMAVVLALLKRRPEKWRTTFAASAKGSKKAALRSYTASVGHRTMRPSKYL